MTIFFATQDLECRLVGLMGVFRIVFFFFLSSCSNSNWQVSTSQYTYLLNICDNLLPQTLYTSGVGKTCNSTTEVPFPLLNWLSLALISVLLLLPFLSQGCQIDFKYVDQPPKKLGGQAVLTVKDIGELELKLTGGDHCTRANVDRSVAILFHCNKAAGLGSPRFIEEDDGVCHFPFSSFLL